MTLCILKKQNRSRFIRKKIENKVDKIIFVQTDNYQVTYYEQFIYNKLNEEYLKKYDIQIYDQVF